jgi:hypothetical protein
MDPFPGGEGEFCIPEWFALFVGEAAAEAWTPPDGYCTWWSQLRRCPMTIVIDIKPGSYPNCLSVNGTGVFPVAINGGQEFDVLQVNLATLRFAGLEVRVKGTGTPQCGYEDWNLDGYGDLICHFTDDPTAWAPGDGESTLTGNLLDGTPFAGTDSICVVP